MFESKFDEALCILQEECAELIQVISKIRRFGIDTEVCTKPGKTNRDLLIEEAGDVQTLLNYICIDNDYINVIDVVSRMDEKEAKLKEYSGLYYDENSSESKT